MMEELIPIHESNGNKAVNARDLYIFLESKQQFADWIKSRIEKYDFIENQDYQVFHNFMNNPNGGRPATEYVLSIGMAKELSMIENNEKGKQARKYFIACEEEFHKLSSPSYMILDPIKRAEMWIEEEKARQRMALENKIMKPKADYFDALVDRNLLTNIRDTAKQIGAKEKEFVKFLLDNNYMYRNKKKQLRPYADHVPSLFEIKDYENNGHAGQQVLITPKGKETFRLLVK